MDDLSETETLAEAAPPIAAESFAVPLTIELERTDVPLARLQAAREGAVLPLNATEGRLAVRILAGTRAIATGQIVSIGDGYGVLIDASGDVGQAEG